MKLVCPPSPRQHHRVGDLREPQGGSGERGLRRPGHHCVGGDGRHHRHRSALLRRAGRHHPEVWGRLLLRQGHLRRPGGVRCKASANEWSSISQGVWVRFYDEIYGALGSGLRGHSRYTELSCKQYSQIELSNMLKNTYIYTHYICVKGIVYIFILTF